MTARATGRERAMGEERELTGRNRERVLKFRDEAGVAEFERKAEEFEVCLLFLNNAAMELISVINKSRGESARWS